MKHKAPEMRSLYLEPTEGQPEEIDVVIEAKLPKASASDETAYEGTFVATLSRPPENGENEGKTQTIKGLVACSVGS